MALAGALEIQIFAEIARLRDDMSKAQGVVKSSMSNIEKSVISAKSMLGSLGIGLGVGYFASLIKGEIDAADAMNDLSHKVGVTIRELAGYKLAADQSGASIEAVAKGIKGLSTYMIENSDKLAKAGITAKTTSDMMVQLADIFQKLPDGMEKSALATKLFGRAGMELIPMLNLGSKGLQEAMDKTTEYGKKMEEFGPKADAFNDKISEIGVTAKSFGITVANPIVDGITKIVNALEAEVQAKPGSIIHWWRTSGRGGNILSGQEIRDAMDKAAAAANAPATKTGVSAAAAARALIDQKEAADDLTNAYNSLVDKINDRNAAIAQEINLGRDLTEAEKIEIQIKEKLTVAQQKYLAPFISWMKNNEAAIKLTKDRVKADDEAIKRYADAYDATEKATQSITDGTKAMRDSTAEMGLSAEALLALKQARVDDEIAEANRQLRIFSAGGFETEYTKQIRESIAALEDRKAAMGEATEASKALEKVKEQGEMWKSVETTAKDTFISIFNSGKSAFDRLKDTLKNGLYALLYEMTVKKWVIQIAAGVGGAGAATAAFGQSAVAGAGGSALGSAAASMWSATGGALVSGYQGAMLAAGLAGPTTAGAGGLAGVGAWAASNPYTAAAAVAVVAAKALGIIGSSGGYAQNTAYQIYGNVSGTESSGRSLAHSRNDAGATFADTMPGLIANDAAFLDGVRSAIVTSFTNAGKLLGVDSAAAISKLDVPVNFMYQFGASEEQISAVYMKAQQDAMTEATKQFAASIGMTVESLNAALSAITTKQQLLDSLKTDTEKLADAQLALVNADIPSTAEGFLALAKSIDPTTAAGQALLTQMIALRPAFDLVQQSAVAVTEAVRSASDILGEHATLQNEYNQLTLTSAELRVLERKSIDASNLALFDKITAEREAQAATVETATLQNEYNQLTLTSAELRVLERKSIDASNLALFDKITAEREAQAATVETNRITNEQITAVKRLNSLQEQLAILQGKTTQQAVDRKAQLEVAQSVAEVVALNSLFTMQDAQAETLAHTAQAAQDADVAMRAVADSMSALQTAVKKERDSITTAYNTSVKAVSDKIKTIADSMQRLTRLSDSLKSVLDGIGATSVTRGSAQGSIAAALAIARAGGVLPTAEELEPALKAISQPSEGLFTNFIDYQRDFIRTANDIESLWDLTDSQLSTEQLALNAQTVQLDILKAGFDAEILRLDGVLSKAQEQVDALNGISNSVLSVSEAIANLAAAISGASFAQANVRATASIPTGGTVPLEPPSGTVYSGDEIKTIQDLYTVNLKRVADAEELANWTSAFMADGVISQAERQQFAIAAIPEYMMNKSLGIPGFDQGINQVPFDMTANIRTGERIMPAADNRELMRRLRDPKANSDVLAGAINDLRQEMVGVRAANVAMESFFRRISPNGNTIAVTIAPE